MTNWEYQVGRHGCWLLANLHAIVYSNPKPVPNPKTSLYRHGNFVIFRRQKRQKKSHIYKSSTISIKQRTLYKV